MSRTTYYYRVGRLQKAEAEQADALEESLSSVAEDSYAEFERGNCEIKSLEYPMLFGESCFSSKESSACLGTVITTTACELFVIQKYQLQTFNVGENLIDRVQLRSTRYPSDSDLIATLDRRQVWSNYREEIMKTIPKGRWPDGPSNIEPFR